MQHQVVQKGNTFTHTLDHQPDVKMWSPEITSCFLVEWSPLWAPQTAGFWNPYCLSQLWGKVMKWWQNLDDHVVGYTDIHSSQCGWSVLPKEDTMLFSDGAGLEPPTLWLLDYTVYHLSRSRPTRANCCSSLAHCSGRNGVELASSLGSAPSQIQALGTRQRSIGSRITNLLIH